MDPDAESISSIKLARRINLSRERGILKQGSENAAAFTKNMQMLTL
jgi:hypothetical protein